MVMGGTHLALAAATGLAPVVAAGVRVPLPALLTGHLAPSGGGAAWAGVGLVLVAVIAGLAPDLDSPDSTLQHAPGKLGRGAGRQLPRALGLGRRGVGATVLGGGLRLVGGGLGVGLALLSAGIRALTGHRGATHTLAGLLGATGLVTALSAAGGLLAHLPPPAILALTLGIGAAWLDGYLTHLLADALTPHGVPLWRGRRFHLLPARYWVRTGSWVDTLLIRWSAWAVVAGLVVLVGRP